VNSKPVVILNALLNGVGVPLDKYGTCYLTETNGLAIKCTSHSNYGKADNVKLDIFLGVDCDISYFVKICNKLTDEQVMDIKTEVTVKLLKEHNEKDKVKCQHNQ
jgi:hypothetical protein